MTNEFKEIIIKMRESGLDLFYNSEGNTEAYKLNVKHISAAKMFGYGTIMLNNFESNKLITLVDFENETISTGKLKCHVIRMKNLP